MPANNAEAGRAFLAQVLAKLPEALRGPAEAAFNAAEAAEALEFAGQGAKRQDEFSRAMDDLRQQQEASQQLYERNQAWWRANQAEVQAAAQLRQQLADLQQQGGTGDADPDDPPADPPAPKGSFVSKDDLAATAADALGLMVVIPTLVAKHQTMFGEVLDLAAVVSRAQTDKTSIQAAYERMYADKLTAHQQAAEAARVKAIEDAAIARFKQENPTIPYPSPRPPAPGVLDAIATPVPSESLTGEALAAEYQALVGARTVN